MDRIILHVDMDSFYASVEQCENPELIGLAVVVGSDPKQGKGRGVVSTCSYEARSFWIHSEMPISRAYRLSQDAVFLPVNMSLYQEVSRRIMKIQIIRHGSEGGYFRKNWNGRQVTCYRCGCEFRITEKTQASPVKDLDGRYFLNYIRCPECGSTETKIYW
jgi:hypothetical protein